MTLNRMMNAQIKYFGGKNVMAKQIISYFPDKDTYDTYIEPFGGSYAVGLHMEYVPPIEIYNDLEKNVYSLYKVLQDKELFKAFKRLCELSPYDEAMRQEYKEDLRKTSELPILNRAYMFFYVNRTSFNGIGGFTINTYIRRNTSKSISDFLSTIDGLDKMHQRLSNVIVSNMDGIELINRYRDKENVLIYNDPPYVLDTRKSSTRYKIDMDDETQNKFLNACIGSKCKMLISGYDNEMYDLLLDNGFNKTSFTVNNRVETIWKNY